ncbi:MAG: ABC transporter permease [Actinomycetota bacterium]|nr:ABC transporter permease [Actinomycetota bacterium]
MTAYLIRRLGQACVVVIGVSLIVFLITHLLPGSPARAILGIQATPAAVRHFNAVNGFDKPVYVQFLVYWKHLLSGNLGFSYKQDLPVATLIADDLPKTLLLDGLGFGMAFVIGIPVGLWQAVHRNRADDHLLTSLSFIGYSMPVFWTGMLLIWVLAVDAHVFPAVTPSAATVGQVLQHPLALVLPVATLAIVLSPAVIRFMRSAAIENLAEDYVRTARAKGARRARIVLVHVLRNSVLPLITLFGFTLPLVLSGSIVVETVFNYPGMGLLMWNAAEQHDYPTLLGGTIVIGIATVVGSLLADLLYAVADPRVRYTR